jgi:hypothetical protein
VELVGYLSILSKHAAFTRVGRDSYTKGDLNEVCMQHKNPQWRSRVQEIFQVCQDEIKRTTEIGKRMLNASKTNSCLHEAYEELGSLAFKALKEGKLEWDNPRVKELMGTIDHCESDLEDIEKEVNKIRFAAGPMDVSPKPKDSRGTKRGGPHGPVDN